MEAISQRFVISMLGAAFTELIFLPSVGPVVEFSWHGSGTFGQQARIGLILTVSRCSFSLAQANLGGLPVCMDPGEMTEKWRIRDVRLACQGPWSIVRDFNLIYKEEDKSNDNFNRTMMGNFRRLINDLALKEIPLHGCKFTWTNNEVSVKLDRVLCSVDWEAMFPNCLLQSAAWDDSDHCPLLLGTNDIQPGKRRFHFEAFWPKLDGFMEAVQSAWDSVQTASCPFDTLAQKLQATSRGLQSWSQKNVGHVKTQLGMARVVLHQLEIAQDSWVLSQEEV